MTWQEVIRYGFEVVMVLGLAYIAMRQAQVKTDLRAFNGRIERKVDAVPRAVSHDLDEQSERLESKVSDAERNIIEAAILAGLELRNARRKPRE